MEIGVNTLYCIPVEETHSPYERDKDTRHLHKRGVWGNEVSPQGCGDTEPKETVCPQERGGTGETPACGGQCPPLRCQEHTPSLHRLDRA
jgi:hypothetical protein